MYNLSHFGIMIALVLVDQIKGLVSLLLDVFLQPINKQLLIHFLFNLFLRNKKIVIFSEFALIFKKPNWEEKQGVDSKSAIHLLV